MYDDIGKKIKILSKVLGILSAIGAIIITIEQEWSALFGITLAATFFLDSWFGYGFGQLVDILSVKQLVHLLTNGKRF